MKLILIFLFLFSHLYAQEECPQSKNIFKSKIHPRLVRSCSACHKADDFGPGHSQKNVDEAYRMAREFVRFPDYENSKMVKLVKDKHWLEYDDSERGMSEEEIKQLLKVWYEEGEKSCLKSKTTVVTYKDQSEYQSLKNLPLRGNKVEVKLMRFDVSHLLDSKAAVFVEVEAQVFTEKGENIPKSFRFLNPRILSDKDLYVEGLHFFTDSTKLDEISFAIEDRQIQGKSFDITKKVTSFPLLSFQTPILIERNKKIDKLAVSFDKIELKDYPECTDLNSIKNKLKPALVQMQCLNCHSQKSNLAYERMPLLTDKQICSEYEMRPKQSLDLFWDFVIQGKAGHTKLSFEKVKKLKEMLK